MPIKPKIEIESTTNDEIKKSHTAEIIVKEEYSGIKELLYKWTKQNEDNQEWETLKGRTIKTPESANGEYYLQIKAIDNAKNEEEVKSRKFIIDINI